MGGGKLSEFLVALQFRKKFPVFGLCRVGGAEQLKSLLTRWSIEKVFTGEIVVNRKKSHDDWQIPLSPREGYLPDINNIY
jgi:hypothetical protein